MLSQDFKEFIESLNANNVRYLVVGGYALAAHGHPRYTKDLDIWIEVAGDNAQHVIAALKDFGFASLGLTEIDFLKANQVVQLGYPPNRIDLLTSIDGVTFEECYKNKVRITLEETDVDFISLDDFKDNKRASGRLQDLADIEALNGSSEQSG